MCVSVCVCVCVCVCGRGLGVGKEGGGESRVSEHLFGPKLHLLERLLAHSVMIRCRLVEGPQTVVPELAGLACMRASANCARMRTHGAAQRMSDERRTKVLWALEDQYCLYSIIK